MDEIYNMNEGDVVFALIKEFIDKPKEDGWHIRYLEFCTIIEQLKCNSKLSGDTAIKLRETLCFIVEVNGGMFKLGGFTRGNL